MSLLKKSIKIKVPQEKAKLDNPRLDSQNPAVVASKHSLKSWKEKEESSGSAGTLNKKGLISDHPGENSTPEKALSLGHTGCPKGASPTRGQR